jgi:predicted dehydrogenase
MADKKLRAGVVGARLGAAHAYAYANSSEYELVAVCDLFPKVIDEMWERAKLPKGSVNTYPTTKQCSNL